DQAGECRVVAQPVQVAAAVGPDAPGRYAELGADLVVRHWGSEMSMASSRWPAGAGGRMPRAGRHRALPPGVHARGSRSDRLACSGRSLPSEPGADPADVLRCYLATGRTASAKALAAKAVVLIYGHGCGLWGTTASVARGRSRKRSPSCW